MDERCSFQRSSTPVFLQIEKLHDLQHGLVLASYPWGCSCLSAPASPALFPAFFHPLSIPSCWIWSRPKITSWYMCPPKCLSIFPTEIGLVTKCSVRTTVCPSDVLSPLNQEGKFENAWMKAEQMSQNFGLSYINLLSRSSELSRCNQILWVWESWLFLWENSSFSMHTRFLAAQKEARNVLF